MITALAEHNVILPGPRFGLVAALAIPGLFIACFRFPLLRWIAGAIALHMISLLSVFVTERYRLAVVPGLLLFAAAGAVYFWQMCVTGNYRVASVYFLLLFLSTWFVSIPKREPSLWALDSYNSGWQALESNDLDTAERKLNLAYAYVPENAETNFALGNLHLMRNEIATAKSYYLATLALDSNHEGAHNNLGILALQEKRWALAAKFFANALQQDPRDPKTYYLLAKALCAEGNWSAAESAIEKAINLDPLHPEFTALLSEIKNAESGRR
jgi:tetratricopeptide (TPR) repeat protein